MSIKIVSRKSRLAKIQVKEIINLFPDVDFDVCYVDTYGDKHKKISLLANQKADFFTDTIDEITLNNKADFAVHSAKDLPFPLNRELQVVALTKADDKTDSLVSRENLKLNQLPEKAKIGTSSIARKSQLLKLRPDILPISIRGNIEERIAQVDSGKVDAIIVATCALKRLGLENRISEILPFDTHPLQGNLAIIAKRGRADLIKMFYEHDIRNYFGKVWLIGAGIGSSDTLTIKAHKILGICDIIFYDDLLDTNILDLFSCKKIYVGKRKEKHSLSQYEINELLYQNALNGKTTVRLKGGDPFIFGRGGEEAAFLQERMIPIEVIPGISSFNASAAAFNIPLTQRNISSSIEINTGHSSSSNPETCGTKVFYMGASKLSEISEKLLNENTPPTTPAILIHNVGTIFEKTVFTTVSEMVNEKIDSPAIIIVGQIVGQLNVPEKILYTGLSPDYSKYNEKIIHYPLIKVTKVDFPAIDLQEYDAIIFTSKSAIKFFFAQSIPPFLKVSDPAYAGGVRGIFSIGHETAKEINKFGYKVDYIAEKADSDSLVELLKQKNYKKVLYPCSDISDNALHKLKNVHPKIIYKTEFINQPKIDLADFKGIVFSSSSTVKSFLKIYKNIPKNLVCYVFGKHTEKTLLKAADARIIKMSH